MPVEINKNGARASVIINRPETLNALNSEVIASLRSGLRELFDDVQVRVIVLSGAGEKAFCAGADLRELASFDSMEADRWLRDGHELMAMLWEAPKPVIAAVNGLALGGGCEMVLAAGLAIACVEARFGLPESRVGLVPGLGGTQRIVQSVGRHRGLRLLLTGDAVGAEEAYSLGLLSAAPVPRCDLDATVDALVSRLLGAGPAATRSILELAAQALPDQSTGLVAERRTSAAGIGSTEGKLGIDAFTSRTTPPWAT